MNMSKPLMVKGRPIGGGKEPLVCMPLVGRTEAAVLAELTLREGIVLATGGGAILRKENRDHLRSRGTVVYLRARPEDLFKRTRHDRDRPLLQTADPLSKLRSLLKERQALYEETAHIVLDTGEQGITKLVATLEGELNKLNGKMP